MTKRYESDIIALKRKLSKLEKEYDKIPEKAIIKRAEIEAKAAKIEKKIKTIEGDINSNNEQNRNADIPEENIR